MNFQTLIPSVRFWIINLVVQYDPNKQAKIEYSSMRKRLEREK